MDPHGKFLPPKDDAEFKERAKDLTLQGAEAVLGSLEHRRSAMVENIDLEIAFYKKVIEEKKSEIPF
jgi:hypothetical protein